jgi:hypothetical protein
MPVLHHERNRLAHRHAHVRDAHFFSGVDIAMRKNDQSGPGQLSEFGHESGFSVCSLWPFRVVILLVSSDFTSTAMHTHADVCLCYLKIGVAAVVLLISTPCHVGSST